MITSNAYTDFSSLGQLQFNAGADPHANLREVAAQFESLFSHMLLKSMRATSMGGGILDSKETKFYQEMFDQQMSVELSKGKGLGLADIIVNQLEDFIPEEPEEGSKYATLSESRAKFMEMIYPLAERAAQQLGVDAKGILSQVALETQWGEKVIQRHGESSYNVFNIKADRSWRGKKMVVQTMEVIDGLPEKQFAAFRAYENLQEAFDDYVNFLKTNPRYAQALQTDDAQSFVQEIHKAGYATDPKYSAKLLDILADERFEEALDFATPKFRY